MRRQSDGEDINRMSFSWSGVVALHLIYLHHHTQPSLNFCHHPSNTYRYERFLARVSSSRMAFSESYVLAPVVYEYIWTVDDAYKQTSTYTTTYSTWPGTHTAYALVVNTAMPSPSQVETVGVPYTASPGETSTQHVLATVATHSPMTLVSKTIPALMTPTEDPSIRATRSPGMSSQEVVASGAIPSHESYFTYLQIVLVCLFCGGYVWSRCRRHLRSRSGRHQERRSAVPSFEKAAIKDVV